MKARDLRDRTTEDLAELERSLSGESFQNKFKNFTNRLDDTSVIRKSRRDLSRVKLILAERARGITVVYKAAEPTPDKPKTRAPKAAAKPVDVPETDETVAAESSEAEETTTKKKPAKTAAKAAPAAKTKAKAEPGEKSTPKKPKPKAEKGSK